MDEKELEELGSLMGENEVATMSPWHGVKAQCGRKSEEALSMCLCGKSHKVSKNRGTLFLAWSHIFSQSTPNVQGNMQLLNVFIAIPQALITLTIKDAMWIECCQ